MARKRLFQRRQAQPLFAEVERAQPVADAIQGAEQQFLAGVQQNLRTRYQDLANQYENKQISDTAFTGALERMVNGITDQNLQVEWNSTLQEAKYMVLSNSQAIEDTRIRAGLASGAISQSEAIARYEAMSQASLGASTQKGVRDSEEWRLKAAMIKEQSKNRGPKGPDPEKLLDITRQYEESQWKLEQAKADAQSQLDQAAELRDNKDIDEKTYFELRETILNELSNEVSTFAFDQDVLDYASNVDAGESLSYLNSNFSFMKEQSGFVPDMPSFFEQPLQQATPELFENQGTLTPSFLPEGVDSPRATPFQPQAAVGAPVTAQPEQEEAASVPSGSLIRPRASVDFAPAERERRANPLGLGQNFNV